MILPDSVTSIDDGAFQGCSGLTSIVIPDSVTSIGQEAFNRCTGLTSIVISDSVVDILGNAFGGCTQLEQVIAPARFHHLFPGVASVTEPTQYFLK